METIGDVRFKLKLQYDGTHFFGWQIQKSERTVQGDLEAALTQLTGSRRPVLGSGRTDRGVHATGQVAAVTMPVRWRPETLTRSLNAILPADIWVESIEQVHAEFNPRFAALARTYHYRVGTTPEAHSPFRRSWCWSLGTDLDAEVMRAAALLLPGRHSFKSFRKSGQPERGEFCTIRSAQWRPWEGLGWEFEITADRYLHHMVRYLVGTMVDVGRNRRSLGDFGRLLEEPDGTLETSPPAPPQGLFLSYVEYDGSEYGPVPSKSNDPQNAETEPAS